MFALGLVNDDCDPCLFTWSSGTSKVILLIYVDDMLLASNDSRKILEIKDRLVKTFEMSDLGEPKNFLGMKIQRERGLKIMPVTQEAYIDKILSKFGFANEFPKNTPMVTRQVSNRERRERENDSNDPNDEILDIPCRETIGSLLYIAGATRPDIAYAVNVLSKHQLNRTEDEWNMVKRGFEYLKGTKELVLVYLGRCNDLLAYSDASFAASFRCIVS